jgi:cytosine/adenosine deaminase-related metal-dependent hydrolase
METFETLAKSAPFGDGRVTLGLAWDLYFLPQEVIADAFQKAKSLGIETITSHFSMMSLYPKRSIPETLEGYGLLDDSILFSHANGSSSKDAELIRKANAHISSTPSTELQMALGMPECWRDDIQSQASLGVDCHSNQLGSVVSEMRLGLQAARGVYNAKFEAEGKVPKKVFKTVEDAFNLGTIQGARAAKMQDKIGSLKEGKLADLVIFDATSPGMICAAEHDPVAAVVLHSSPGDFEAVMVDGIWRKREGRLLPIEVEADAKPVAGKGLSQVTRMRVSGS